MCFCQALLFVDTCSISSVVKMWLSLLCMKSCAILNEFRDGVTTHSVMSLDHGVDVLHSFEASISKGANVVAGTARERDEDPGVAMNHCGATTHGYYSGYLGERV